LNEALSTLIHHSTPIKGDYFPIRTFWPYVWPNQNLWMLIFDEDFTWTCIYAITNASLFMFRAPHNAHIMEILGTHVNLRHKPKTSQ
jgi:hypothetical protein